MVTDKAIARMTDHAESSYLSLYLRSVFISAEVHCSRVPQYPTQSYLTVISDAPEAVFGSVTTIRCLTGFRLEGRWSASGTLPVTSVTLMCTSAGLWNDTFPDDCAGQCLRWHICMQSSAL
jgi:Sushi repeat (SCR repeat)